jgi:hypothetical protein
MGHRVAVEVINKLDDALFQFVFRGDADVTKDGARSFSKEALDKIEPGAVLGGEHELEAFVRSGRQPSLGFFGDVRRVIVQDDFDRRRRGVGGVEQTEEFDKFATAVAIPGLRRGRLLTRACTWPVRRSMPAIRVTVPCRLYS